VLDNLIHGLLQSSDTPNGSNYDYEHIYAMSPTASSRPRPAGRQQGGGKPKPLTNLFLGGGAYTSSATCSTTTREHGRRGEIDPAATPRQPHGHRPAERHEHQGPTGATARQFVEKNQDAQQYTTSFRRTSSTTSRSPWT